MSGPRILIFDIETSPLEVYAWSTGEQHVGVQQIIKDWSILSFAAKWAGEPKMYYFDTRHKKDPRDDRGVCAELHALLSRADATLTQNGVMFDHKKANSRFLVHGFTPPPPVRQIDLLQINRKKFGHTSNSLEYVAGKLNKTNKKMTGERRFHGLDLWKECLAGNKAAWAEMETYNKRDVLATEEAYKKVRHWDPGFNLNAFNGTIDACSACGSKRVQKRGIGITPTGTYQRYQCMACGHWMKTGKSLSGGSKTMRST